MRFHQVSGMKNSQHNLMICIVKGVTHEKRWGYCLKNCCLWAAYQDVQALTMLVLNSVCASTVLYYRFSRLP